MSENISVLFLGRLFPKNNEKQIREKATVDMQDAANVFQWNIINGLFENGMEDINIVSLLPIDSWPKHYKSPFIRYAKENTDDKFVFETAAFCNITYIKQLAVANCCNKYALRWAKKHSDKNKVVICYSENNTLMRACSAIKRKYPNTIVIQIIADITEFAANAESSFVANALIRHNINTNNKLRKHIDGFVILTKHMKNKLGLSSPSVVMEGIVPEREFSKKVENTKCDSEKIILYTGSMNKKYGILQLLEAFSLTSNSNYRLCLCGLGNAEPVIAEYCSKDSRIEYLGKVAHEKVLELQQQATVLVNPRQNNEEFTKYSFPSKTMEYLASGVPLVAYKLDGIPDEYDEYINYIPDNSPEAFAKVLSDICEMPEDKRKEMALTAQRFVLEQKNRVVQTKKILELIEDNKCIFRSKSNLS